MTPAFDVASLIPNLGSLPAPEGVIKVLLFFSFVVHILMMNTLLGVSVITLVNSFRRSENLALLHRNTKPLPKAVALTVNFGVAPLLFVQGIYGAFIYTSSVLMALWWISVMAIVMLAYYGLYIYTSDGFSDRVRTAALAFSVGLLLLNAFIFVNNMTLMQAPGHWVHYAQRAGGIFLNISVDPQVLPRYLHVILASLAVGGLWYAVPSWLRLRSAARSETALLVQERHYARMRQGLRWFFYASLLQFLVGPWFLLSLPSPEASLVLGGSVYGTLLLAAALVFAVAALVSARRQKPVTVALCLVPVVLCMAGIRTMIRNSLLAPYVAGATFQKPEISPIVLFLVSFAVTLAILSWMLRLYRADENMSTAEALGEAAGISRDKGGI